MADLDSSQQTLSLRAWLRRVIREGFAVYSELVSPVSFAFSADYKSAEVAVPLSMLGANVTGADVHMPYSKRLEQAAIPHQEHIVSAALATLEGAMA